MLVGMLAEGKARRRWRHMSGSSRRTPVSPVANDLAYFLSETNGDKERALQLAQVAKEAAPDEPHISDTLGWILYQRGIHARAVALLQEAASKAHRQRRGPLSPRHGAARGGE